MVVVVVVLSSRNVQHFAIFVCCLFIIYTYTHTCLVALFRTTQASRYQKGKTNQDFTEARDSE